MKLSSLSSMALAALLLAGTATAANALDFDFSFSDDGSLPGPLPFPVPGTVTGEITGLTDNATSAATHVWIDSAPLGLDLTMKTPFDTIANVIDNSFTVSGGQIIDASYFSSDTSDFGFTLSLSDSDNLLSSNPNDSQTGNSGGFAGVTYAPVPETSTWAMLLVGFAGLGFAGYRAKAKRSLSAA
jgi:hypothetical protein